MTAPWLHKLKLHGQLVIQHSNKPMEILLGL